MSVRSERTMPVASREPLLERRRMSREEFDALPREVRAEYVRGVALMSPPPVHGHQFVAFRIASALAGMLPKLHLAPAIGLDLGESLRVPDVSVFTEPGELDEEWGRAMPLLVVEVLSRTTRSEDLIRKPEEYLRAGIAHYWILDRRAGTLMALTAGEHGWNVVLELDDANPRGAVDLGDHGSVSLDLTALLDGLR